MLRHEISNRWTFREAAQEQFHSAQVPGCVHTDLLRNGLIPDPFFGTNEQELQWIGERDWIYQTTFDLPANFLKQTNAELVLVSRLKDGKGILAEDVKYFCLPKDLKLSPPEIVTKITKSKDGCVVELSCRSLARSVRLACGDDDGFFSENYFDLLPGETKRVEYRTSLEAEDVKRQLKAISLTDS